MQILFIGGPLDGTTVHSDAATPVFEHKDVAYTLRQITGPAEPIYFYTAPGMTEHGAIVRVFTAYVKKSK